MPGEASSVTAICVYRTGGDYGPEHVLRLREQLREHAPEWQFLCLTDDAEYLDSVQTIELAHLWPGWWSKLEAMAFVVDPQQACVYLDLDTTIRARPVRLEQVARTSRWSILRDAYRQYGLQSSIMTWQGAALWSVYAYARNGGIDRVMRRFRGDQDWIEECVRLKLLSEPQIIQEAAPGACLSYKVDLLRDGVPLDGCEAVFFHGSPRPWEVPDV